jgi:hypothetical protein
LQYLDANGNTVTSGNEADIDMVQTKLEIAVDRGISEQPVTQVLQTMVALRNRSDQG